jgi:hypothetical protein
MVYGKDYSSALDVVGHELSHGFTSFTSNLFYFFQSGAINESLSDTFGELIQRSFDGSTEWLMGEDLPIGAIRSMKKPPMFGDPDKMKSPNYTGDFSGVDRGGVHTNSGVGNKTAYLITDGDTFNGQTVHGIGLDKAAAIYYRLNAMYLQSGSDYADYGNALKQSCADLVGTTPKNKLGKPSNSGAITAANCKQVGFAALATELKKQPPVRAIPAEAPVCSGNKRPVNKMFERFEGASFKFVASDGNWGVLDMYAASNKHSVEGTSPGHVDTNLAMANGVSIPANAFLRFAHYYNMPADSGGGYAGAVVEYQIGNGAWKRVTPDMFLNNKYNVTLRTGTGNALAGQRAFSGFSAGWTSSRVDLSSLAGKKVKFRFRVATDNSHGGFDGWILDDIQIYTCAAPAVAMQ